VTLGANRVADPGAGVESVGVTAIDPGPRPVATAGGGGAGTPSADRAGRPGLRPVDHAERAAGCGGLTATASVVADADGRRPRIRWTQAWPIVVRPTGDARVHLVHGAGGPLGGDALALDVRVGTGATLAVRSAGATIVQPGRAAAPARWDFGVVVGTGATLDWAPEPTVVTARADYRTSMRIDLAAGARAVVREVVVLGRNGGAGGRYRGRLDLTVGGHPLLAHTTVLDGEDPALCGPGGIAGGRAVGTLLVVGDAAGAATAAASDPVASAGARAPGDLAPGERGDVRWAWTDLAGPGRALFAVGEPGAVIALLAAAAI